MPVETPHSTATPVAAKPAPANQAEVAQKLGKLVMSSAAFKPLTRDDVQNVVVAIHGIGDQVRNDTVLATAIRFCERYGYPGLFSLGAFQPGPGEAPGLMIYDPPRVDNFWGRMAFAEAHWADVARGVDQEGYTLQESKAWARTIVNRVRVLAIRRDQKNAAIDYRRIRLVLEEIIDAIGVIETLLLLTKKAGLGEFNLKKVLDAYLGDVQLVTEFAAVRAEIVSRFVNTMADVSGKFPNARLHIVSHSQGTVVSFLGLLEACDHPDDHAWIHRVRGFMTLGSPIDKHLILWPGLFRHHRRPSDKVKTQIHWVNYTDYGDPVGFTLDTARDWLEDHGYARILRFDKREDFCFRRYPIPGKAHVDYWKDSEVFGDFIQRVVNPEILKRSPDPGRVDGPPKNKPWMFLVSHVLAYLVPLALVHFAVYVLVNGISDYYDPKAEGPHVNFVWTVLALAWLLTGTTVWLRLMRLTREPGWIALGGLVYAAGLGGYLWAFLSMDVSAPLDEFAWFDRIALIYGGPIGITCLVGSIITIACVLARTPRWNRQDSAAAPAATPPPATPPTNEMPPASEPPLPVPPQRLRSGSGQKRMIWMTGAGMLFLALFSHVNVPGDGSLLRLLLAIAIFLYLWWLGSLLFDLVFIWHRYVRSDAAMDFLRKEVAPPRPAPSSTGERPPEPPANDSVVLEPVVPIPPSTPRNGSRARPRCFFCGFDKSS